MPSIGRSPSSSSLSHHKEISHDPDAAAQTLYPELERMYQNRHSMSPMRREHVEIRRLVGEFAKLTAEIDAGHTSLGRTLAVRRVLFQIYALLKIHLAQEEVYLPI